MFYLAPLKVQSGTCTFRIGSQLLPWPENSSKWYLNFLRPTYFFLKCCIMSDWAENQAPGSDRFLIYLNFLKMISWNEGKTQAEVFPVWNTSSLRHSRTAVVRHCWRC